MNGKKCLLMNAWMHDDAKNIEYMGARFIMLEVKVTPFGKDYGFNCTCNKGSTKFPNYNYPYELIGA
jgi:hypothetical protein